MIMKNDIEEKSKTRIKKEAEALQDLGMELMKLPVRRLEGMALPDELRKALTDARSITSKVAGKRQRQFIGAPGEPEPVKEARMWMDRLLSNDPAHLEAFVRAFPGVEHQRLRQLLRNIQKEKTAGKASRSLKALEQLIMESLAEK